MVAELVVADLASLHPEWVDVAAAPGVASRWGLGVAFDCTCGCGARTDIRFVNPVDGMGAVRRYAHALYLRSGSGFGELYAVPLTSPKVTGDHFQGFILQGKVFSARPS